MTDAEPDDDDDLDECCELAEMTGESHYHCGNCGKVSSMMGHWDYKAEAFTCGEP